MIVAPEVIRAYGWTIHPSSTEIDFDGGLPLVAEPKFAMLWPRLGNGLRWILLDLLRRYQEGVMEHIDDLSHAPVRARIRLTDPCGICPQSGGDFIFRLMLPNKGRKTPPFVKLTYVNNAKGFSCWPETLRPSSADSVRAISLDDLKDCPIVDDPARPVRKLDSAKTDPVAEIILSTIPDSVRGEVVDAILRHRLVFHSTNRTGEADSLPPPVLGVESRGGSRLSAVGQLSESIYFQNGWLMVKLAKLPVAIQQGIDMGGDAEKMFAVRMPDGRGGTIRPFEGLRISKCNRGTTWMGKHVQVKFEK